MRGRRRLMTVQIIRAVVTPRRVRMRYTRVQFCLIFVLFLWKFLRLAQLGEIIDVSFDGLFERSTIRFKGTKQYEVCS